MGIPQIKKCFFQGKERQTAKTRTGGSTRAKLNVSGKIDKLKVIKGRSSTAGKLPLLFPADEQSRSHLLKLKFGNATFREARKRPTSDFVIVTNKISPEISDADIAKELNNKSVTLQVKSLISARHNYMPSHNVKLTCENKATLEAIGQTVTIKGEDYKVIPYVNKTTNVKQCYRCLEFGHTSGQCANDLRCRKCGGSHVKKDCHQTSRHASTATGTTHLPTQGAPKRRKDCLNLKHSQKDQLHAKGAA